MLKFVPVNRPDFPALFVGLNDAPQGSEFIFECVDQSGEAAVRTFHARFADALQQVVSRMRTDSNHAGDRIDYTIEVGT